MLPGMERKVKAKSKIEQTACSYFMIYQLCFYMLKVGFNNSYVLDNLNLLFVFKY